MVNKSEPVLKHDDQQGLVNFIKQMYFNGISHYLENSLISFLQKLGVYFGVDLYAYYGSDETVYQFSSSSEHPLNNSLETMGDWAHRVKPDTIELDQQRLHYERRKNR